MDSASRAPLAHLLGLLFGLAACQPEIGDACSFASECSSQGDRTCDITLVDTGYCTQFNCEPGTCPEEAICVAYHASPSQAPACEDPQQVSRFQRTFCMRKCEDSEDCRPEDGIECIDISKDNRWGAVIVERGSVDGHICAVPSTAGKIPSNRATDVCTAQSPVDAALPDAPPLSGPDGGTDARGDGSADGGDASSDARGDASADGGDASSDARRDASADGARDGSGDVRRDASADGAGDVGGG